VSKCDARCLELRLGDMCIRCERLVDLRPLGGWSLSDRTVAAPAGDGLSESQQAMLDALVERYRRAWLNLQALALPRYFVAEGEIGDTITVRKPNRFTLETRPIGSGPRSTDEAIAELEPVAMAEGPKPRAADDADAILRAQREIYQRENRRPIACAPGQHNFQFSGGSYTCSLCGRGKVEDGRA
jgi:hypothetical protein